MNLIIPALIPKTYADVEAFVSRVRSFATHVQIDVTDGIYAGEKSWPYSEHNFSSADVTHLPEGVTYEVDLMVSDPHEPARAFARAGASRIIVHVATLADPRTFALGFKKEFPHIALVFAFSADVSHEVLSEVGEFIDGVQCMGIAKIGFQGQPFDERVLEKISAIHTAFPGLSIGVDGGVSSASLPRLKAAGVTRFVAGSAILNAQNPQAMFEALRAL